MAYQAELSDYIPSLSQRIMWDIHSMPIGENLGALPEQSMRYPLPVRLALGRVVTMEEFEARREEILARPLP